MRKIQHATQLFKNLTKKKKKKPLEGRNLPAMLVRPPLFLLTYTCEGCVVRGSDSSLFLITSTCEGCVVRGSDPSILDVKCCVVRGSDPSVFLITSTCEGCVVRGSDSSVLDQPGQRGLALKQQKTGKTHNFD